MLNVIPEAVGFRLEQDGQTIGCVTTQADALRMAAAWNRYDELRNDLQTAWQIIDRLQPPTGEWNTMPRNQLRNPWVF